LEKKLNEKNSFAQELNIPIKSFRLYSIEKAIKEGNSPDLLSALEERMKIEEDEECHILLQHAIEAVKIRVYAGALPDFDYQSPADFFGEYSSADQPKKFALLGFLESQNNSEFHKLGPQLLNIETNPVLASCIIKACGKNWPNEHLEQLSNYLFSENVSVRLAALEVLIQRSPNILENSLPHLLISPEPRTRALAVRGLAKIDQAEALNYLEHLLFSPDQTEKFLALQNCFFFPFEPLKPLLIKFISLENDLEIINRFGWLFESNPDPQVPFQLLEIAETSSPEKAEIIKTIVNRSCKILKDSGILGEKAPDYFRKLQDWVLQKNANRFVQEWVENLPAEEDSRSAFENAIDLVKRLSAYRVAFENALAWDIDEKIKEKIMDVLKQPQIPVPTPKIEQPEKLDGLTEEEISRKIAGWKREDLPKVLPVMESLIKNRSSSPEIRAGALRAAIRLGQRQFCDIAEKLLQQANMPILAAALQYLENFDIEKIAPYLGNFLASNNKRIKIMAFRIMKKLDSANALSFLKSLLTGVDPKNHSLAMTFVVHFDFPSIRELLVNFCILNPDSFVFPQAVSLFEQNPDIENLFCLYKMEKSIPPSRGHLLKDARNRCVVLLKEMGLMTEEAVKSLESDLATKWKIEQELKNQLKPPYAFKPKEKESPKASSDFSFSKLWKLFGKDFLK